MKLDTPIAPAGFDWKLVCQMCGDICEEAFCPRCDRAKEPQHEWEFYFNGSFYKRCGAAIGSGSKCR